MKKFAFLFAMMFAVALVSCENTDPTNDDTDVDGGGDNTGDNNGDNTGDKEDIRVLTFEDEDYKAGVNYAGGESWSSLIDDPQYGGLLLYGETGSGSETAYEWTDKENTFLHSGTNLDYGSYALWNGGEAVSNYVDMDAVDKDFANQLAVYYQDSETGFGGYKGSKNFGIHFGTATMSFTDEKEHTIEYMYVCNTTFFVDGVMNGNSSSEAQADGEYAKIVATGYKLDGTESATAEYTLAENGVCVEGWNKFDLSSLGEVSYVEITVTGNTVNDFGFSLPAYFAFDNVTVKM